MSTQTHSVKRRLTLKQNGKRKKYFLKKKSWLSFGNRTHQFRYFDEDGYEVFDPLLIGIIFDHWYDIYDVSDNYVVECDLDTSKYNLFDDDDIETTEQETTILADAEAETFEPLDESTVIIDSENEAVEKSYVEEVEEDVTSHQEEEYVSEPEPYIPRAPEPEPERYEPPTPSYEEPSRSYSDDSSSFDSGGSDSYD